MPLFPTASETARDEHGRPARTALSPSPFSGLLQRLSACLRQRSTEPAGEPAKQPGQQTEERVQQFDESRDVTEQV
jgi:hypothetical protein